MEPTALATALATAVLSVPDPIPQMRALVEHNRNRVSPEMLREMEDWVLQARYQLLAAQVAAVAGVMYSIEVR